MTDSIGRMRPPTQRECAEYWRGEGLAGAPEPFWEYYEAVGWKSRGIRPIRDWKAVARRWAARVQA